MTTRNPPSMSVPDWIERQIKTAEAAGAFDNLPGKGKPIPGIDRHPLELAWIANYLRREEVDVAGLLPPGLALAKEVEVLPVRVLEERSERRVRELVEDLNKRIRHTHLQPQVGPPLRVRAVGVETTVREWREGLGVLAAARPAPSPARSAARSAAPVPEPRRRWRYRRSAPA